MAGLVEQLSGLGSVLDSGLGLADAVIPAAMPSGTPVSMPPGLPTDTRRMGFRDAAITDISADMPADMPADMSVGPHLIGSTSGDGVASHAGGPS
jgi:hypothetical protein